MATTPVFDNTFFSADAINLQTALQNTPLKINAYDYEYYGACQVSVYIGDIWIDEIVALGYSFSHAKTPLFGYASTLWDTVATGQKMVSGQFAINFKETAYLQLVLNHINKRGQGKAISVDGGKHNTVNRDAIESYIRKLLIQNNTSLDPQSAGGLLQQNNQYATEMQVIESLYGFLDQKIGTADFEQMAEALENQLWKGGNPPAESRITPPSNLVNGFDIYLVYGDYQNPLANHTTKKIINVHLTGQSQSIVYDGQPVLEIYPFIARNIDEPS